MEKGVTYSSDNCFICSEFMGEFKNELTIQTVYSEKQIFELIEELTEVTFSQDSSFLQDAGICQNCFIKFNDYTEHLSIANQIQCELLQIFEASQTEEFKLEQIPEQTDYYGEEDLEQTHDVYEEEPEEVIGDPIIIEYDLNDSNSKNFFAEVRSKEEKETLNRSHEGYTVLRAEDDSKLYQCDICRKAFKERSKLKTHREIHTTERNVICPTCGKAFKTQACLRSHKRVHNPTYLHCDMCGRSYTQKPELAKHIKFFHYQIRDHSCEICGASFGSRGHLLAHKATHQSAKTSACGLCELSFHTRAKLERHMVRPTTFHHNSNEFLTCFSKFSRNLTLENEIMNAESVTNGSSTATMSLLTFDMFTKSRREKKLTEIVTYVER